MKITVEICCGSYYDAYQAYLGGARRIELNSALFLGGLTPSLAALQLTKQYSDLEVVTMVRPRGGGFCYMKEEFETMLLDTELMLEHGADGIAFGCLDEHGEIAVHKTKTMVDRIHQAGKKAIFHRAFDCVKDPLCAIQTLISLGVDRILTSGFQPKATDGAAWIKKLQDSYGEYIEILAGSGINASNAKQLISDTGIHQIHASCKTWLMDPTTSSATVSYAYDEAHKNDYDVVDRELVEALLKSVDQLSL